VSPTRDLLPRLRRSLLDSIGDVAFGMEDGAVSIAGLVFGVAASTNDASIVLLAGATGAAAGAVSMMAGTYLDVHSENSVAKAQVDRLRQRIEADPDGARERVITQLRQSGFTDDEAAAVSRAFMRNPRAMLDHVAAYEVGLPRHGGASPRAHALWMFLADLLAAGVPVLPFALFPIEPARLVSLVITGMLMAALGVARGLIGHEPVWRTTPQTMAIAGAAALAGVVIGRLVSA
jgi:VIT1/CCC1 family predicted Fe2+/Mn2+ transporter